MKNATLLLRLCFLPLVIGLAASPALAGPTLTLSSPSDLTALTVGQLVEIDVTLSGLPVGTDFIFNLNSKVLFPSAFFQAVPDPTSTSGLTAVVAPGSVFDNNVQGPLQVANFNYQGVKPDGLPDSSLASGAATGIFSQYPNTNSGAIGLNGLYYSFLLRASSVGIGTIEFDPTPGANQYAANDTGFNYAPLPPAAPLAFVIAPAVPEPSSLGLCGVACLAGLGYARVRRRAA